MKFITNRFFCLLFVCSYTALWAQDDPFERFPIYEACSSMAEAELVNCFYRELVNNLELELVKIEDQLKTDEQIVVRFLVNREGNFELLRIDNLYAENQPYLETIFESFEPIKPATYNGRPIDMQFLIRFELPFDKTKFLNSLLNISQNKNTEQTKTNALIDRSNELDSLKSDYQPYANQEFKSPLQIPFSHHRYYLFDQALNQVGGNAHTSVKPLMFDQVSRYYDFEQEVKPLIKKRSGWWGRKWWNEHLVTLSGKDYWFAFDMGVDLQLGRDTNRSLTTWNNTRLATVSGGIGKQLSFSATVFESQGFFAGYFNDFARSIAPAGGNPGIIPGMGVGKEFNGDSFDFPVATGYVSYQPSKYFNFQLGHGKQFIGDGYRSLFISDFASPYPYAKLTTRFWKLEYTNTWMSLRDVRREVAPTGPFKTKFIANHYLSWNVSKRLNLGFYETVIWDDTNDRGFDFNFLNPVIFFRAIEFSTGSRGGNALIGLSAKYKYSDRINFYAQWLIDEFSSINVFKGDGSYKNKFGIQLGTKYYNAFGVDNLMLQLEYNQARPYTYTHNTIDLNFAHTNLALAHPWGASFREGIAIARYQKNRWYGDGKIIVGRRGLDFDGDDTAFGGDIFTSENNRPQDNNNSIGQGNTTDYLYAELEAGYLINPMSRLKVFGNIIYRNASPVENTAAIKDESTFWVSLGIRTDIFNWYKDF